MKETETQTADEVPEAAAPELVKETVTKTKTETPAQSTAQASTESQPTQPRAEAGADQDSSFKPSSTGRPAPQPCETVYVGNLFFDVSAEQLGQHMAQFGPVEAVRIIHDARGLSRGYVPRQNQKTRLLIIMTVLAMSGSTQLNLHVAPSRACTWRYTKVVGPPSILLTTATP